ncbi:MAG: hypothetical protein ACOX15_01525 [Tepidanaerobacteraceae bacterium]|jgi:hypothetical protein
MFAKISKNLCVIAALMLVLLMLYITPKSEVAYNTKNLMIVGGYSNHELVKK